MLTVLNAQGVSRVLTRC